MRIQPTDPIFNQPGHSLIRKYFLENGLRQYTIYGNVGNDPFGRAIAIAPTQVLLKERSRLTLSDFFIQELVIREGQLSVQVNIDGDARTIRGATFGELLATGESKVAVASEDPDLQKSFPLTAGLYNYGGSGDSFGVNFSPHFGHGEHAEYFISSLGTPFGFFSPASFTGTSGIDRHQSRELFEELLKVGILNRAGTLEDEKKLANYSFKTALSPTQADAARRLILHPLNLSESKRRFERLIEFAKIPQPEKDQIANDLKTAGSVGGRLADLANSGTQSLGKILGSITGAEKDRLLHFFVSREVSVLAQEQIVRPRGILKENFRKEALIQLYEPIHISSQYYGRLLSFFQKVKEGYTLYIALAYSRTVARGRQKFHPLVEALRDLENLKTIENVSPLDPE